KILYQQASTLRDNRMRDRAFYCRRNSRLACNSNLSRSESVLVLHLLAATKSKSKFKQSKNPCQNALSNENYPERARCRPTNCTAFRRNRVPCSTNSDRRFNGSKAM